MGLTRTLLSLCLLAFITHAEEMRFSYDLPSGLNICFNENAADQTSSKFYNS